MRKKIFFLTLLTLFFFIPSLAFANTMDESEHACCLVPDDSTICSICKQTPKPNQPVQSHIHMTVGDSPVCTICGTNTNNRTDLWYSVHWEAYGTEKAIGITDDSSNYYRLAEVVAENTGILQISHLTCYFTAYLNGNQMFTQNYIEEPVYLLAYGDTYTFQVYSSTSPLQQKSFNKIDMRAGVVAASSGTMFSNYSFTLV